MSAPLISIIVPVYNAAAFLTETVDSIFSQSFEDWELILVDDGSTDESPDMMARWAEADSRVRLFRGINQGQQVARNIGIGLASGSWIKILDHDDLLVPEALETLLTTAEEHEVAVVAGQVERFDTRRETGPAALARIVRDRAPLDDPAVTIATPLELLAQHHFTFNEVLIDGTLLRAIGFNRMLKTGEELDCIARIDIHHPDTRMAFLDDTVVTAMRVGLESLAVQLLRATPESTNWHLQSLQCVALELQATSRPATPIQNEVVFDRLYQAAAYAFRDGQRGHSLTALEIWKRADLTRPTFGIPRHDLLHDLLGFWGAEKLLSALRVIVEFVRPTRPVT